MNEIGERLRRLRKEAGITQGELARKINEKYGLSIDRVMVSKWETGFQVPSIFPLACLAQLFEIPLDYFSEGLALDASKQKKSPASSDAGEDERSSLKVKLLAVYPYLSAEDTNQLLDLAQALELRRKQQQ